MVIACLVGILNATQGVLVVLDKYPRSRKISVATGLFAGVLALTGCAASGGEPDATQTASDNLARDIEAPPYQKIERRINSAGFVDTFIIYPATSEYDKGVMFVSTSYCDNKDLIDFSYMHATSRSFSRTPDALNTVCDDGKLTKEDFPY